MLDRVRALLVIGNAIYNLRRNVAICPFPGDEIRAPDHQARQAIKAAPFIAELSDPGARRLFTVTGSGQGATARVMTELPTQNDLGEVQRVCGHVLVSKHVPHSQRCGAPLSEYEDM